MLQVDRQSQYIEDERNGLKYRPYDFGTDAIERMRVANPESLIDADFEYGLQATKWHNVGTNNNIPSFYEASGAGLDVTAVSSGGTGGNIVYSVMTVTVTANSPAVGTPISIFGLSNPLAEGVFVVLTSTATTFTYQAKGLIAAGSVFTPYTVVKSGGIFTGASLPISTMCGNGAGGVVTVNFSSNHGLYPGRHADLWGVYRFKRGFGGRLTRFAGAFDRVYDPLLYKAYELYLKTRGRSG